MTLEELHRYKPQIDAVAAKYGIINIRVFGSTARRTASAKSDVDLLIQLPEKTTKYTIFDHIHFQNEVSEILQVSVDIVNDACLDCHIASYIFKEAVAL